VSCVSPSSTDFYSIIINGFNEPAAAIHSCLRGHQSPTWPAATCACKFITFPFCRRHRSLVRSFARSLARSGWTSSSRHHLRINSLQFRCYVMTDATLEKKNNQNVNETCFMYCWRRDFPLLDVRAACFVVYLFIFRAVYLISCREKWFIPLFSFGSWSHRSSWEPSAPQSCNWVLEYWQNDVMNKWRLTWG